LGTRPFGLYLHIPFCAARCGYCDFNTYVQRSRAEQVEPYLTALRAEIGLAANVLGGPSVATVFFGGGTPTMLSPADFAFLLDAVRADFGLGADAEVTTEANPETLSPDFLAQLRLTGVNRLSLGMQSADPDVLATLDRKHTPGRVAECVRWARDAGFQDVSLDLIYGTPGEGAASWRATLEAALATGPTHLSAYSLTVERGTALAARVARGELPGTDEDDLADKYLLADERLAQAGYPNYEISNWSLPGMECRHNLGYWKSHDWWGVGAGSHSHVGGVRWWNLRHPRAYTAASSGRSPAQARESLTLEQRRTERVLLESRLATGLSPALLTDTERLRLPSLRRRGLLLSGDDPLRLSVQGKLLADAFVRDLLD
jgi:oxygen-independent coproporphyrinogen-3 oxidase